MTISETIKHFEDYLVSIKGRSLGTVKTYLAALNRFIAVSGDKNIFDLKDDDFTAYKSAKVKAGSSQAYIACYVPAKRYRF